MCMYDCVCVVCLFFGLCMMSVLCVYGFVRFSSMIYCLNDLCMIVYDLCMIGVRCFYVRVYDGWMIVV